MGALVGAVGFVLALVVGLVLLVLSVIAAMPWLGGGVPNAAEPASAALVIHIPAAAPVASVPDAVVPPSVGGNYTMAATFHLFLSLGATRAEAVLLTAICRAENGSGNPTAIGHNRNAPDDVGLCQINASHVPALAPSYQALEDPVVNATVALRMLRAGGPKQWCTYPGGCGGLPGVPNFASLLAQAQAVAEDQA